MKNEDLRRQLYDLRQQSRERYLQFMGVDVGKLRELESDINAQYEDLAVAVQDTLKDLGQDEAGIHTQSLKRARTLIAQDAERAAQDTESILAILKRPVKDLLAEDLAHLMFAPPWRCAYFGGMASPVSPPTDEVDLDLPPKASGSVTYNAADNIAHPNADAQSPTGTATVTTATVKTSFRFSFTPETDRSYCIRPFVYMNGHWLVWTWGSCSDLQDRGSGAVAITLRVRVDQLSLPVKQIEHKVLEQTASDGEGFESGFAYDSEVDGGATMQAYLQGGHEAVIWVECESYAQIVKHGRAWVDMQTSPSFYFMVPEVWWGWLSPWAWPFP